MSSLQTKRWTRAEYDRLIDLGVFGPEDRLELLGGQLVVAEPRGAAHYSAVRRVTRALEAALGPGWEVRPEGPIALDAESEPEPDVAVVPGTIDDYRAAHPACLALAVEIAVSSLALDRMHKAGLYARAGVADYWIVNLVDRVLEVHRAPAPDPAAPYGWSCAAGRGPGSGRVDRAPRSAFLPHLRLDARILRPPMRPNRVKKTLREGGVAIGTSAFEFASPGLGRLAAGAGADFLFMDMEHTGWSEETIKMLVATSRAAELVTLVRVPATQYHLIARVLDVGADGIMVPMCESAEQARLLVQSAKYPPVGRRGSAFGIAHDDYSGGDAVAKIREANAETWLCALVETVAGIESVDAIAAVDGIDVVWLGHFDLTNSMGIPTQFTHPDYLRAVDRLLAACRKHGKAPGHLVHNVPDGRAKLEQGFRCLSYSSDMWLFKQALADGIGALRKSPPAG